MRKMAVERKKSADPRRRYRRQIRRAESLAASERHAEACVGFRRALEQVEALVSVRPDDADLKRDMARLHQAIGWQAKKAGDLDAALAAHRACFDLATELAILAPDNPRRQFNIALAHADLRDVLQARGELRLAVASGRLAAVAAEQVADRFADRDGRWRVAAMRQRLQLARLLREEPTLGEERIRHLDLACRHGEALIRRRRCEPYRDEIRRAFLDFADALRVVRRYDDALGALGRFRFACDAWLARARDDGTRHTQLALADYLAGLVHDMKGDGASALQTYLDGLIFLDQMPLDGFLTDAAQTQRGRLLAQAIGVARALKDRVAQARLQHIMLARLQAISESDPLDVDLQHQVMSVADDLARSLIGMKQPAAAIDALRFARGVLEARALGEDDLDLVLRWRAFLTAEEGRALRHLRRYSDASSAFRRALALNEQLAQRNPGDVRAQCDIAFGLWQLALCDRARRAESLRRSRAILRFLDRTGRLPPYARARLPDIERDSRVA